MRRCLWILVLAACGPKPRPAPPPPPSDEPVPEAAPPAMVRLALRGDWVAIACAGDIEGVGGGSDCIEELGTPIDGCTDARGPVRWLAPEPPGAELQLGGDATPVTTPKTDPRDKREHLIDLDGNGTPEQILLIPHDNRASYGRSLTITDGHDPLMSDEYDPFPDAADVQVLGTSDVDGDGRRELILYAPDEGGFGIAVQEYWAAAEAYRLDCRNP